MKFDRLFEEIINGQREVIDWEDNYGKSFKLVRTPEGKQSEGTPWSPDLVSVVTPENGEAWTNWPEVDKETLLNWQKNWPQIQKSLGQHKYDQIIRSRMNK